MDAQLRTAFSTFTLTTQAPPAFVTIRTIQANKPSTYATQTVTTSGIVIGVKSNGFYLEATETNTSNGRFYGVVTGVARPFREPGLDITDLTYGSFPAGVPLFDSNPELLYIDSLAFGGPAIDLTSNATVTGLVGVMDFSFG